MQGEDGKGCCAYQKGDPEAVAPVAVQKFVNFRLPSPFLFRPRDEGYADEINADGAADPGHSEHKDDEGYQGDHIDYVNIPGCGDDTG